jgi:hypothetical protein
MAYDTGIDMVKLHAARGQLINVRGVIRCSAVTAEHFTADIISQDEQYVWRGGWPGAGTGQQQDGGHGNGPCKARSFDHFV